MASQAQVDAEESAEMPDPAYTVVIEQSGRGGSIFYREGENTARFSWEFAMPPAIALLFGPSPWPGWAAGRQAEIYAAVGAEVVRQKAPGGRFTMDLDAGMMEVLR
jgi:hypothetical protein